MGHEGLSPKVDIGSMLRAFDHARELTLGRFPASTAINVSRAGFTYEGIEVVGIAVDIGPIENPRRDLFFIGTPTTGMRRLHVMDTIHIGSEEIMIGSLMLRDDDMLDIPNDGYALSIDSHTGQFTQVVKKHLGELIVSEGDLVDTLLRARAFGEGKQEIVPLPVG